MKNILVLLFLVSSSAFASSKQVVSKCLKVGSQSNEDYPLIIYKESKVGSKILYFAEIRPKGSAPEILGPADKVAFENSGKKLVLIFDSKKIWFFVNKGTNARGAIGGELGGYELICNSKW
jgi:hypothetical protein